MANPTLAVLVEAPPGGDSFLGGRPPRVRITVTDTGTPAVTQATVTRTDQQGNVSTVRTSDGGPLPLLTSGSNRVGVVWDYEAPFGQPVTYSLVENAATTATVTVSADRSWLIDVGVPERSLTVRIAEMGEASRSVNRGVFRPLGRRDAIAVTDGARKSAEGGLSLLTLSLDERRALLSLLDNAGVVLFNTTDPTWGIDPCYLSFGDVEEARVVTFLGNPARRWSLPYTVVASPEGGSQAAWTWADVMADNATWAALMAAEPTWGHVLAPTD